MVAPKRRRQPCGLFLAFLCILLGAALPPGSVPPLWWQKGRPRKVLGSRAEAELLSQLAVLMMPDEPISEAFRDFSVERCEDWGSSRLSPDLAAHGVLNATDAALFIEYDGYYRHGEPLGMARDKRKTRALLRFAPPGSVVVRIAHERRQLNSTRKTYKSVQILVDCWCNEHTPSLLRALIQFASSLLHHSRKRLLPALASRLAAFALEAEIDHDASIFAKKADIVGNSGSRRSQLQDFLQMYGHLSVSQVGQMVARSPRVLGLSIEANLKPTIKWIQGLGLSQSQAAKVIATCPSVLGYSIEANLKPTVEWIQGLGLSQPQLAKVITSKPQVLGLSIEANLKPTVEWIQGLGLSQPQLAKVITSKPQVLGYSIEANLKPTVEWIQGLGLSQSQVAKVIATCPSVLGLSIEANLKPTVEWIQGLGLSQSQVAKVIATCPSVLGYSIEANLKPTVEWIQGLGLSQPQLAKVITSKPQVLGLSIEANLKPTVEWIQGLGLSQPQLAKVITSKPQVLGYSIEANLKPTVEWIQGLGLSQSQVSDMISMFPPILGLSIETNLAVKHRLLQQFFPGAKAAQLLAQSPRLWSYRYARLEHRLAVLKSHGQLSKLTGVLALPLEVFSRRYRGNFGRTHRQVKMSSASRDSLPKETFGILKLPQQ